MGSRGLPPENFRNLSVVPEQRDFADNGQPAYVRPNKVQGPYDNNEHYLDIHFRLLREDLLRLVCKYNCSFVMLGVNTSEALLM